jgi:hypothetical protein
MPKVGRQKTNKVKIPSNIELTCAACGEPKKSSQYYISYNPIHSTGRIPYCKICLKKMICDEQGNVTLDRVQSTLQLIDRPFIYDLYKISLEDKNDNFGTYMKNLCLRQNRELSWKDSIFKPQLNSNELNYSNSLENNIKQSDFILTNTIEEKWGYGYSVDEYEYFEKKWNNLIGNYGEKTSFHIEGLKTYIRFRVKEELATAKGDVKNAKEWGSMAKDAATAAKINVSQLSKSDISGGVDLLPQLFEAVESEVGIISILPHLKEQPYDDADLIIWCIVNYCRRLEDKPRIEYKEIWQFYDQMLEEYYKQKGFSKDKIKEEKIKRNNIFRDLGEVYREPVYEESDL